MRSGGMRSRIERVEIAARGLRALTRPARRDPVQRRFRLGHVDVVSLALDDLELGTGDLRLRVFAEAERDQAIGVAVAQVGRHSDVPKREAPRR